MWGVIFDILCPDLLVNGGTGGNISIVKNNVMYQIPQEWYNRFKKLYPEIQLGQKINAIIIPKHSHLIQIVEKEYINNQIGIHGHLLFKTVGSAKFCQLKKGLPENTFEPKGYQMTRILDGIKSAKK